MRLLSVLLMITFASGCATHIVRNKTAVTAEINFTNNLVKAEAQALSELMSMHCVCADGKWTTQWCDNAADVYAVYLDRWEWHLQMTKHLSLDEERPKGEAPPIRTADEMCALFNSPEGSE